MDHDQHPNGPRGEAPAVLEHKLLLPRLGILKGDVEHLAEVLSQVMGRCTLNGPENICIQRPDVGQG